MSRHIFQDLLTLSFCLILTHLHIQYSCNLSYPCMFYTHYYTQNSFNFFHNSFHQVKSNQLGKHQENHQLSWRLHDHMVYNPYIRQLQDKFCIQNTFFLESSISLTPCHAFWFERQAKFYSCLNLVDMLRSNGHANQVRKSQHNLPNHDYHYLDHQY